MTRFRYPVVIVILVSWTAVLLAGYVPRFYEWSVIVAIGWPLTVVAFVLSALIRKEWKAFATFSLLLVVLIASDIVSFAYRLNNFCGPNEHILQSKADAVLIAKKIITKGFAHFSQEFGSDADVANALEQTDNCCDVTRSRNIYGVIVWDVRMAADKGTETFLALMELSNCGALFFDTKFQTVVPRGAGNVRK